MSTASELVNVLGREAKIAHELLEILQLDQQRIVRHDVEGLELSNRAKEELVLGFQALDQVRVELSARLGRELGLPADEIRVSRLCPLLIGSFAIAWSFAGTAVRRLDPMEPARALGSLVIAASLLAYLSVLLSMFFLTLPVILLHALLRGLPG